VKTKQKGKLLYLLYLERRRRGTIGNFSSLAVKTKQKGKPLYLLYLGEGEERSKGTFHLW
jgi:hypothetical protein